MVKIEVISEAQAVVETTKGPAGARLRGAMEALGDMGPGRALRIDAEDGDIGVHKVAFQKASAAIGKAVRLRIVGNTLYVMHGQQGSDRGEEPEDPDEPEASTADEGQVSEPPDQESEQRADESLARTRVELDNELRPNTDPNRCLWADHPHEHDIVTGACLLPESGGDAPPWEPQRKEI